MIEPIIVTKHLSYLYRSGSLPKVALDDVSMEIARGTCVALIGFNGSGKSTLIQHFNGLLRPTSGTVIVDGINVGAKHADLTMLRQRVGLLFQFPEAQLFEQTVFADVAFAPRRMKLTRREIRLRVLAALDAVGLPPHVYAQRSPFDLSGGQRRRVALAGVLAMSPAILILDEPSVGLDAEGRDELYQCLDRIQRERDVTIVLVSHDMAEVASIASAIYVLAEGKLVMQGDPRTIFAQGEQLQRWHLALPPLHELLHIVRKQGIFLPDEIFTLDEAYAYLTKNVSSTYPISINKSLSH